MRCLFANLNFTIEMSKEQVIEPVSNVEGPIQPNFMLEDRKTKKKHLWKLSFHFKFTSNWSHFNFKLFKGKLF